MAAFRAIGEAERDRVIGCRPGDAVPTGHIARCGGLPGSWDRLADLDGWGLETIRRLLVETPVSPFISSGTAAGSSSPRAAVPDPQPGGVP